ncbi:hypothetical protein [Streptomonospora litoralis]|uniref:Uncharacterized protein n=1 Tax=Streptomonospora litoralis TaxID=2498135 RepID=A0A4P6PWJ3_9ACTN|nr:hypothetical protein [Streptomonospora litoralis]QBI52548.1 hypothetical protein EKD16_03690 [Streptomonospora litoralis]
MATLDNLRGATLTGIRVDAPGHRVALGLRLDRPDGPADYTLVLEGVTDFSCFDESASAWPDQRIGSVSARHDPESMHLDFAFARAGAGMAVTCGKAVLRRAGRAPG